MSRDKKIDEMAMLICKSKNPNMEKPCSECVFNRMCDIQDGCEALIENGYRKASDVVREIFEEIDTLIVRRMIPEIAWIDDRFITDITELKKKYESEGEGSNEQCKG